MRVVKGAKFLKLPDGGMKNLQRGSTNRSDCGGDVDHLADLLTITPLRSEA